MGVPAFVAAILVALGLIAAPATMAAWTEPLEISPSGVTAVEPQIAVDHSGNATAVWVAKPGSHEEIVSSYRPAGGLWETPVTLISEPWECRDPQLDVNPSGAAAVVADCAFAGTLRAAYRPAGTTAWDASVEVTGSTGASEPSAAVDDAGRAIAVWEKASDHTVHSSYRLAGTAMAWGSAQQVSPAGKVSTEPDMAMNPTGLAVAVWNQEETVEPKQRIETASRLPEAASTWSAELKLGQTLPTNTYSREPAVAINAEARSAVWSFEVTTSSNPWELRSAWGSGCNFCSWGGSLSSGPSDGVSDVEVPRVAVDEHGRTVAVWRAYDGQFGIQASTTEFVNGSWSSPLSIGPGGTVDLEAEPQVAIDPEGAAVILWGENGGHGDAIMATSRSAGGSFSPVPGTQIRTGAAGRDPRVAMDTAGDAVATWGHVSAGIEVSVNDVAPPVFSSVDVPSGAQSSSTVAMSASATDVWTAPVSIAWDFGDGATASGESVSHAYATAGTKTVTVTATDGAGNTATQTREIAVSEPSNGGGGSSGGGGGTGGSGGGGGGGGGHGSHGGGGGSKLITLGVSVRAQSWKAIAKAKAIKVLCSLKPAGTCKASATVTKAVAKRLGLKVAKRAKTVKVGSGSVRVTKAGKLTGLKLKLTAKARAAIAKANRSVLLTLTIIGSASASGYETATLTRHLTIPRPG